MTDGARARVVAPAGTAEVVRAGYPVQANPGVRNQAHDPAVAKSARSARPHSAAFWWSWSFVGTHPGHAPLVLDHAGVQAHRTLSPYVKCDVMRRLVARPWTGEARQHRHWTGGGSLGVRVETRAPSP